MSDRQLQILLLIIACILVRTAAAQHKTPEEFSEPATIVLHGHSPTPVQLAATGGVLGQSRCDGDGNLYLRLETAPLVKISAESGATTTFGVASDIDTASSIPREIRTGRVIDFVATGNAVYLLMDSAGSEYIAKYSPRGEYDSTTRLDIPDGFRAVGLAMFADETFLIQGELIPSRRVNQNGQSQYCSTLAVQDGRFLQAPSGRTRPIPEIESGTLNTGSDGNVYVMRKTKNPLIYVIGSGGLLLRTLTLAAPKGFEVGGMSIADGKILLDFQRVRARISSRFMSSMSRLKDARLPDINPASMSMGFSAATAMTSSHFWGSKAVKGF